MSTSSEVLATRTPTRLRMKPHTADSPVDGGWWPQSRDLAVELADLVEHFPADLGRILRVVYSPPDWDSASRRIPVRGGYVHAGSFPHDDTHLIQLRMFDRSVLDVVVVPSGFDQEQGEAALAASAQPGNPATATRLLQHVIDTDADPIGHWSDDGGSSR